MMTVAPRSDNIFTIPFPRPVPPPVTNAILPSKHFSGNIQSLRTGKLAPLEGRLTLVLKYLVLFILFINKSLCLKGSILDIKCHNERTTLFEAAMLKSAKNAPSIPYWNLLRTNFLITPLYYVLNLF